jgi:cytoskeletal protein CcmA (bactofilin family)
MFSSKPSMSIETNSSNFASHATASDANCSIINEWLTMRGDLESQGDILVKGKVHGNIACRMLIVDSDAIIDGGITAEEIVIRGTTRGSVKARRVRVERTANVEGEIYQESFASEEGAKVRGALHAYDSDGLSMHRPSAPVMIAAINDSAAKPANSFYQRMDAARAAKIAG